MTKMVKELTRRALDWAVATAEGYSRDFRMETWEEPPIRLYSTEWSDGGPIIESNGISIKLSEVDGEWHADKVGIGGRGPTPLIAAMRCYALWRLGDEIDVPEIYA